MSPKVKNRVCLGNGETDFLSDCYSGVAMAASVSTFNFFGQDDDELNVDSFYQQFRYYQTTATSLLETLLTRLLMMAW